MSDNIQVKSSGYNPYGWTIAIFSIRETMLGLFYQGDLVFHVQMGACEDDETRINYVDLHKAALAYHRKEMVIPIYDTVLVDFYPQIYGPNWKRIMLLDRSPGGSYQLYQPWLPDIVPPGIERKMYDSFHRSCLERFV